MKTSSLSMSIVIGVMCLVSTARLHAATIQSLGAGSAVSVVDLMTTFDSLNSTNTMELGNYTEAGLSVTTGSQAWGADPPLMVASLDPFHGAGAPDRAFFAFANGTLEWVIIQTTHQTRMHAVEFLYGNTWTTGDIYGQYPWGNNGAYVEWQTLDNGTLVSSGQIGPNPMLPVGTVIGFYDPAGFDQLQVKCKIANSSPPDYQAIALDDLMVQLTNRPPAPVIYGSDFSVNPTNHIASLTVWETLAGVQYRLAFTENLASGIWTPVTPPLPGGWVSGGGPLTFTDSGATGRPARFYRVEAR
jgi:hypothetical protein